MSTVRICDDCGTRVDLHPGVPALPARWATHGGYDRCRRCTEAWFDRFESEWAAGSEGETA